MYLENSPYQRDQLINIDQVIGRSLDRGVDLGEDHRATIERYVSLNLIPRLLNGEYPATVVDRLVSIDRLVKEGKSLDEIQKIIKEERKKFLKQPLDLPSMVDTYKKASKSLLMLSALALFIYLGAVGLSSSSNPIAQEVVGKPVGNVLAAFIRQAKNEGGSTDPLGITNISKVIDLNEDDEIVLEKNIAQTGTGDQTSLNLDADKIDGADAGINAGNVLLIDSFGDINIPGNITIEGVFTGDGSGLTNLNLSSVTPTISSLENLAISIGDNIDLIAGSGLSINVDQTARTITFGVTSVPSTDASTLDGLDSLQFLRSDTSDSFTSGTLTLNSGTSLNVLGSSTFTNIQINNNTSGNGLLVWNANPLGTGIYIGGGANDGSITTGVRVGGAEVNGEDITTGYLYKISGLNLFGVFTFSATGTDGYLAQVACTTCTTATATLTNGFHVSASGLGTTVTNGLNIEAASSGVITTAININGTGVVTDLSLQNGETIDNNVNGTIALGGDLDVSGHGAFGASASVSSSYLLNIFETISAVSSPGGIASQLVVTNNSNTQFINGFSQYTTYSGSGTNQTLTGLSSYVSQTSGSATFLYGADISVGTSGTTSSAGTVVGLKITASSSVATAVYGLNIEDITFGTTKIPIFQAGTSGYNLYYASSNMFGRSPTGDDTDYRVVIQGSLCVDDTTANCPNAPTSGAIYVENSVGTGNVSAFDISEYYPASEDVEKGDVVVADTSQVATVKRSTGSYQTSLIGVVATDPAIVINESEITFGKTAGDKFNSRKPYIALAGRVPVKVSTENGAIKVGDYLTSSSTAGVAMKATSTGPTIGKALENYSGLGVSKILVFVDNSFYVNFDESPTVSLNSEVGYLGDFISKSGQALFSKVTAAFANFGKLVFGEIAVEKSSQSAGQATLLDGQSEVFVSSNKVETDSLINLTPDSEPDGVLYVKEKLAEEGFVVGIKRFDSGSNHAIKLNWFILNQE